MLQNTLVLVYILLTTFYDTSLGDQVQTGKFKKVGNDVRRVTGVFGGVQTTFMDCISLCLQNSSCKGFNTNSTSGQFSIVGILGL